MTGLAEIVSFPMAAEVSPQLWAAAAFIGGLRTASNQGRRPEQDRGPLQNAINDMQGVLGELLLLEQLSGQLPATWTIGHSLLHWDGGGGVAASEGVDITLHRAAATAPVRDLAGAAKGHVPIPSIELRLEAKAHLEVPDDLAQYGVKKKRDFAVNYQAVVDSHANEAAAAFLAAAAPGRALALIGRLVPLAELLCWEVVDYGYGHPALRRPLRELAPAVWDRPWTAVRDELAASRVALDLDTIIGTHQAAFAAFDTLRDAGTFELSRLTGSEAVRVAVDAAREHWRAAGSPRYSPDRWTVTTPRALGS
jgi:hypothetical protein